MNELSEIAADVRRKIPWMTISAGVVRKDYHDEVLTIRAKHHATGFDDTFVVSEDGVYPAFGFDISAEAELAAGYFLRRFDEWLWSEDRPT